MTGLRAVSHIAIGVRDLETSLPFYRDLLGMRVVVDREERFISPATDPRTEVARRAVYLRWADGEDTQFVVLDQHLGAPAQGQPAKLFQMGLHHVGFWVDDVSPYIDAAAVSAAMWSPRRWRPGPLRTRNLRAAASGRCT